MLLAARCNNLLFFFHVLAHKPASSPAFFALAAARLFKCADVRRKCHILLKCAGKHSGYLTVAAAATARTHTCTYPAGMGRSRGQLLLTTSYSFIIHSLTGQLQPPDCHTGTRTGQSNGGGCGDWRPERARLVEAAATTLNVTCNAGYARVQDHLRNVSSCRCGKHRDGSLWPCRVPDHYLTPADPFQGMWIARASSSPSLWSIPTGKKNTRLRLTSNLVWSIQIAPRL